MHATRLRRFVRAFSGSSFPTLVETQDGKQAVMKMRGAGNGPESLVAEYIVNRVAALAGWSVPDVFLIDLPESFPWEFGTDEFDDIVQKSFGLNLGITPLDEPVAVTPADYASLPFDLLCRMACLDRLFCNADRLSTSGNILRDRAGKVWLVDHGSCRFLSTRTCVDAVQLFPNHFMKSEEARFASGEVMREVADLPRIRQAVNELPEEWLVELCLPRETILRQLGERIARLDLGA
jgi:hypothetical protein